MISTKKIGITCLILLIGLISSGCGPSPEEQAATAAVLTAEAATSTPTVTPNPTSPLPCSPVKYTEPEKILFIETNGTILNMSSADFNSDGEMDVVFDRHIFRSPDTFELEILVNDGNGGLRVGTSEIFDGPIPKVQHPRQMLIADFNGDGRSDIFIADHGQDSNLFPGYQNTLVLSSPGGKMINATSNLPQQSDFTHSAASGDIDGDGDVDLFVGNIYGDTKVPPQVWVNDGSGSFSIDDKRIPVRFTDFSFGTYTASQFVDINKDGFLDLILGAANDPSTPVLLLNDGYGYFEELPNAFPPKLCSEKDITLYIESTDFDNDGLPDLILASTSRYKGRYLQILINNGDGTFTDETKSRLPQSINSDEWIITINLVDLDHDGDLDITTTTMGGKPETLPNYLNNGEGFFTPSPYVLRGIQAWQHVFIDLDGDGGLDILSSNGPWENNPETHFILRDTGCNPSITTSSVDSIPPTLSWEIDVLLSDTQCTVQSGSEEGSTQGSNVDFLGAIGEWESTDFSDDSHQTLTVEQTVTNTFSIVYIDERASICGVDEQGVPSIAAQAEGEGNSSSNTLSVNLVFSCAGDTEWLSQPYSIVLEYNIGIDSLTDNFGNNWTRTQ